MNKEERKAKREQFTESIRTRVTPDQKELIEFWAGKDSRTVSQFVRVATLRYVNQLKTQEVGPELLEFMKMASMDVGDALEQKKPSGGAENAPS